MALPEQRGITVNKIGVVDLYVASIINEDGAKKARLVLRLDNGAVYPLMDPSAEAHLRPVGDDFKEAINEYHKKNKDNVSIASRMESLEHALAILVDDVSALGIKVDQIEG